MKRVTSSIVIRASQVTLVISDWNDLGGMPLEDLIDDEEGEHEKHIEEFEKQFLRSSLMNVAVRDLPQAGRVR